MKSLKSHNNHRNHKQSSYKNNERSSHHTFHSLSDKRKFENTDIFLNPKYQPHTVSSPSTFNINNKLPWTSLYTAREVPPISYIDNDHSHEEQMNVDNENNQHEEQINIDNDLSHEEPMNVDNDLSHEEPMNVDNDLSHEEPMNVESEASHEVNKKKELALSSVQQNFIMKTLNYEINSTYGAVILILFCFLCFLIFVLLIQK